MTPLNTIIEEEKKEFENLSRVLVEEKQIEGYGLMRTYTGGATQEQIDFLTTAMQRAYDAGEKKGREEVKRELLSEQEANYPTKTDKQEPKAIYRKTNEGDFYEIDK